MRLKGMTIGNDRVDKIFDQFDKVLEVMIKIDERVDTVDFPLLAHFDSISLIVKRMKSALSRLRAKAAFDAKACLEWQDSVDEVRM
jgi:hypothetical protein